MATPSNMGPREPEQVKAFRDTRRYGIIPLLTRSDRLTVARDLLQRKHQSRQIDEQRPQSTR
jgi:hypothetical protein